MTGFGGYYYEYDMYEKLMIELDQQSGVHTFHMQQSTEGLHPISDDT